MTLLLTNLGQFAIMGVAAIAVSCILFGTIWVIGTLAKMMFPV